MSVSANTLFHFTKSRESLLSILKNGLYIRYCLETYGGILEDNEELVLPMCCFCDIPLSNTKEHTEKYGSYSIGLTKEWGMRNGISPVLYTHKNSETAKLLNSLNVDIDKMFEVEFIEENEKYISDDSVPELIFESVQTKEAFELKTSKVFELSENVGHFLKYIKPYSGIGFSNGEELKSVNFYNEKEWRYVPPKELLKKLAVKDIYKRKFYVDPRKRRYINIKLATQKKLTFNANNVKYIVVESEHEIPIMIKEIINTYGKKTNYEDLMLLTSRIISLQQIISDF